MFDDGKVRLQFARSADGASQQDLIRRMAKDITELQLGTVSFEYETASAGAKPGTGLIECAGVVLAAGYLLRDLLRLALDWAQRAKNPVQVRLGDDELVLDNASYEQQEALIEAFLAKHSPDQT